jgi:hypothetical protein
MARDSMTHARRFVSEVFCLVDLLVTQPRMGRMVPELRQDRIREHFVYSYKTTGVAHVTLRLPPLVRALSPHG